MAIYKILGLKIEVNDMRECIIALHIKAVKGIKQGIIVFYVIRNNQSIQLHGTNVGPNLRIFENRTQ